MSIHRDCGAQIRWAKRPDDCWLPPLELKDQLYVIEDDELGDPRARLVNVYQVHNCDPERVVAWREYQARLATLDLPQAVRDSSYLQARELEREEVWAEAIKRPCSRCGAKKKKKCTSMAKGPKFGTEVRWPHPERLSDAA